MSIIRYRKGGHKWAAFLLLLATTLCRGQASETAPETALVSQFVSGASSRYEFDGTIHLTAGHVSNVKLNVPDDCSYRLRAVLKFDFGSASADGALSGQVRFQAVRYDGPTCAIRPQAERDKSLQDLQENEIKFDINPAGDTRLSKAPASGESEAVSVLLKAAWDLLQVRLSDKPLSPGPTSFPSRRFLYWPDTFVEDMEVAATSMQYVRNVKIGDRPYAWLQYKHVFSPADMPAYVETRTRARDFTGTTFVTGRGNVSILFDGATRRIVYLRRERSIDNRLMLKYESNDSSAPVATYSIEEESVVRWLPEKNSEAWLADLHKFESEPMETKPIPSKGTEDGQSLAALAAASRRARPQGGTEEHQDLSELLDRTPHGYERWQNTYCSAGYCFDLSIAVPEQTKVADRTDSTVLLLSGSGERTITVAVGPMLDRQSEGLDEEELLHQQTTRFIANNLWFAGNSGVKLNFERSTVHDRPAGFSDFTATARDLKPIGGRLVMVIGPYGRLTPVSCSYAIAQQEALDAICQTVTGSVRIR